MSYANWALLRTIGNLAGNQAYYATKQKHALQKQLGGTPDNINQLEQSMRVQLAESAYGQSDPKWENKIRTGMLRAKRELTYLNDLSSWSDSNCYRFLEVSSFLLYAQENEETKNDLFRKDLREGVTIGGEAFMDSMLLIQSVLNGRHSNRIPQCASQCQEWYNRTIAHPDLCWVLAEACIGISSNPSTMTRPFGELQLY